MPRIENELILDCTRSELWRVLVDTDAYPEWNPRLIRIDGKFMEGAKVTLFYTTPEKPGSRRGDDDTATPTTRTPDAPEKSAPKGPVFRVDVNACRENELLSWKGGMGKSSLFLTAEHYFRLDDTTENGAPRTKLTHGERFGGVFSYVLWPVIRPVVRENHKTVNAAIRRRCEALCAV